MSINSSSISSVLRATNSSQFSSFSISSHLSSLSPRLFSLSCCSHPLFLPPSLLPPPLPSSRSAPTPSSCLHLPLFTLPSSGLLESLSYTLYDTLRPIIIHTNHLETLADYCTIFKVTHIYNTYCYYDTHLTIACSMISVSRLKCWKQEWNQKVRVHMVESVCSRFILTLVSVIAVLLLVLLCCFICFCFCLHVLGKELAAFGGVVKQMLEDVQQRLIFMAQVGWLVSISMLSIAFYLHTL